MEIYIHIALLLSVIIGGVSVLFLPVSRGTVKLLLTFSGSYLFSLCVLHLIPESYMEANGSIGIYVLIGFLIQLLLEYFSEGVEHGHMHYHPSSKFPTVMMISLCIHAFLEGMPLGGSSGYREHLLAGILLHKIPVAITLMSMFIAAGLPKGKSLILLAVFALMAPAGMFLSNGIGGMLVESIPVFQDAVMGLIIGILLHISTTILFETSEQHRFHLYKFLVIIIGAVVAFISV